MKLDNFTIFLILSILASASVGAGASYYFNKILYVSHTTTYSLDEELTLYDQMIEKTKKKEINESALIRLFESYKKSRISAHKLMETSQRLSNKVFLALGLIVFLQIYLIFYVRKSKS